MFPYGLLNVNKWMGIFLPIGGGFSIYRIMLSASGMMYIKDLFYTRRALKV